MCSPRAPLGGREVIQALPSYQPHGQRDLPRFLASAYASIPAQHQFLR